MGKGVVLGSLGVSELLPEPLLLMYLCLMHGVGTYEALWDRYLGLLGTCEKVLGL